MENFKKCRICGRELPLSEFYTSKTNKDGLTHECKDCTRVRTKLNKERRGMVANTLRLKGVIGGGEERTPNQIIEEIRERVNILRGIGMEVNMEINYTRTITI